MDLTLNLGSNREEFIEKLATYRYVPKYLTKMRQKETSFNRFMMFIIDKVNDNTVDTKREEYNIKEEEIEAKLEEIEAREQAGGGKKLRKKSRKHKKRKSKKSRKHRRKTKSHYRR